MLVSDGRERERNEREEEGRKEGGRDCLCFGGRVKEESERDINAAAQRTMLEPGTAKMRP